MNPSPVSSEVTNDYFLLAPSTFLVRGAKRGALYDLASGKTYSIDELAAEVLDLCEQRIPINDLLSRIPSLTVDKLMKYLDQVVAAQLGRFYASPVPYIEKINPPITRKQQELMFISTPISRTFLELTPFCNLNCSFCRVNDQRLQRRTGCTRHTAANEDLLALDDWQKVIDDLAWLRCGEIQIMGGEPLLVPDLLMSVIEHARIKGIENISMLSNLYLINEPILRFLAEMKVHIMVQMFTTDHSEHDRIVGIKGSYKRLVSSIRQMQAFGIPYSITGLVSAETAENIEEFMEQLRDLEPRQIFLDVIRPTCSAKISTAFIKQVFMYQPLFPIFQKDYFFQCRSFHGCWLGKAAVSSTGDIYPCISAVNNRIGNVRHNSLKQLYAQGGFSPYWNLSLEQIPTCSECEFRYVCFDCRPLTQSVTGDLHAKSPYCTYDPYLGMWQEPEKAAELFPVLL